MTPPRLETLEMTEHSYTFRVRYSEIDQLGTYYNSRALEWFEAGRSELSRAMGLPYTEWERRGFFLPLVEAHVRFQGRAGYDDLLKQTLSISLASLVKVRFENSIVHADSGAKVAKGWTHHAIIDRSGKPTRAPDWAVEAIGEPAA